MIEERGQVVAIEPGAAWVETVRLSACQTCSANKGCGHVMLDRQAAGSRARIRALIAPPLQTLQLGEQVVVGLPEDALLKGALLVYFLPLVLLFTGALLGSMVMVSEYDLSVIAGLFGLALGFIINRWYSKRHANSVQLQPQVLRVL